jgi:hypothetical protein
VPVSATVMSLLEPCGIAVDDADRTTVVRPVVDADFDPGCGVEPQAGVTFTEAWTVTASNGLGLNGICGLARADGPTGDRPHVGRALRRLRDGRLRGAAPLGQGRARHCRPKPPCALWSAPLLDNLFGDRIDEILRLVKINR